MGTKASSPTPLIVPQTLTNTQLKAMLVACADKYNTFQTDAYAQKDLYDKTVSDLTAKLDLVTKSLQKETTFLGGMTQSAESLKTQLNTAQRSLADT